MRAAAFDRHSRGVACLFIGVPPPSLGGIPPVPILISVLLALPLILRFGPINYPCEIPNELFICWHPLDGHFQGLAIDLNRLILPMQMLQLHAQIMIGDRQHGHPLLLHNLLLRNLLQLPEHPLQQFILNQYNRQHCMLMGLLVPAELAQYGAHVQVGVGEACGLLELVLEGQRLEEVG